MKIIAVSNRVDIAGSHQERRDSLDQRWIPYLKEIGGFAPLSIPNNIEMAKYFLSAMPITGILLTGGNDLVEVGGDAPERDATERFMVEFAIQNGIPLLGVCRGMQVIQQYFGGKLEKVEGHANCYHQLMMDGVRIEVNSYHNYGIKNKSGALNVLARAPDGVVEAVCHPDYSIEGIMWHPERNDSICDSDKKIFKKLF